MIRHGLKEEGLTAPLYSATLADPLPFADKTFDAILSVQTLHHARIATIQKLAGEIGRVLKPNGLLFVTVPKLQNQAESYHQIEANTYVPLDGPETGLPHHYFDPVELETVFSGFTGHAIHLDSLDHYCLTAYKNIP